MSEPPRASPRQIAKIRKQSGLTPDEHHDRIRQQVQRIARESGRAQREIVRRVAWISAKLRRDIRAMAASIDRVAFAAIAQVEGQARIVRAEITRVANEEHTAIEQHNLTNVADIEGGRTRAVSQMAQSVRAGSAEIRAAHAELSAQYTRHAQNTGQRLTGIARNGRDPGPSGRGGGATGPASGPAAGPAPSAQPIGTVTQKGRDISAALSAAAASASPASAASVPAYKAWRTSQLVGTRIAAKQASVESGASARGAALLGEGVHDRNLLSFLQLLDEGARGVAEQTERNRQNAASEILDEQAQLAAAKRVALAAVREGERRALVALTDQVDRLREGILRAARQAKRALELQAEASDNAIRGAAPELADQHRTSVQQLRLLVPPGRMLNHQHLAPRLRTLDRAVGRTLSGQVALIRTQTRDAETRARESCELQSASIRRMGESATEAFGAVRIATVFNLRLERHAFTGTMSAGAAGTLADAKAHGERVVRGNARQPQTIARAVAAYMERSAYPSFDRLVSAFGDSTRRVVNATPNELGLGTPEGAIEVSPPGPAGTLLHEVSAAANDELNTHSQALIGALPRRRSGWRQFRDWAWGWSSNQNITISSIAAVPPQGRPALEYTFQQQNGSSLAGLIRSRLSGRERTLAIDLLYARNVRAAHNALRSNAGWWGINDATRDAVLASLSQQERSQLTARDSASWTITQRHMRNGLSAEELQTTQRYIDVGQASAMARDLDRRLNEARRQGDAATLALIQQVENEARAAVGGRFYANLVPQNEVDALLTNVYREHARLHSARPEEAAQLTQEQARERFVTHATRTYTELEERGSGEHSTTVEVTRQLSDQTQNLVRLGVTRGTRSDAFWAAQTAQTVRNAEQTGTNNTTVNAVTRAVANPNLDRALAMLEESRNNPLLRGAMSKRSAAFDALNRLHPRASRAQREAAEARLRSAESNATLREHEQRLDAVRSLQASHDQRMTALARNLLPAGQTLGPNRNAGTEYLAQRLGNLFSQYKRDSTHNADGHLGREYGQSLARRGRGTMLSGVMLATMGSGTNEDLLDLAYEGRRQSQIRDLNQQYATRIVGDPRQTDALNNMLGFGPRPIGLPELSGDDLQRVRLSAMGEPETDRDHTMQALQRINDQLYLGTGPMGRRTMRGTPQQESLLRERQELVSMLQRSAASQGGRVEPAFDESGHLNPLLLSRAFNDGGRLQGGGNDYQQSLRTGQLIERAQMVRLASDNYRAELDRQEQSILQIVAIIGAIIAVALLFVLNPVAAAVVGALIAGALTMGTKALMRGGRYGWEEAATDTGMMLMEATVGAVGGGFAMRAARAGAPAARAAAMTARAAATTSRGGAIATATSRAALSAQAAKAAAEASGASVFARVMMNPVGRGAITQGVSAMGSTAMQDRTWDDGKLRGFGRVGFAGARGAIVGALTEGISTRLGGGMQHALDPTFARKAGTSAIAGHLEAAAARPLGPVQRFASAAGARLGSSGREAISQGISDAIGGVIGQSAGVLIDVWAGTHQGGWQAAAEHLLTTAGREFLTSGARGAVTARNRNRLTDFQEQLRQRSAPPTEAELSTLARYARVAGQSHTLDDFRQDLALARIERNQLVAGLPPGARARWAALPLDSLRQLHDMVAGAVEPNRLNRQHIADQARAFGIELDPVELGARINEARAEAASVREANKQARRSILNNEVPNFVRSGLGDADLSPLRGLPEDALRLLRERIATNTPISDADQAQILAIARAARPDTDAATLAQGVRALDAASQAAHQARANQLAAQRERLVADLPGPQRAALTGLPEGVLNRVAELASRGQDGTPADLAAIRRSAGSTELGEAAVQALAAAAAATRQRTTDAAEARRQARLETLAELPEQARGPLSQLPPKALELARQLIEAGTPPNPQQAQWLLRQARREQAGGGRWLLSAIDAAIQHIQTQRAPENALRQRLLAAVPPEAQGSLARTRVSTLPPDAFDALARTPGAQVLVDASARPARVFVRDGADDLALMQAGARLIETRQRNGTGDGRPYDGLSSAERLALHRATVDLELAAQTRVVESLRAQLGNTEMPRLREMLARAEAGLFTLQARQGRLSRIGRGERIAMALGVDHLGVASPPALVGMAGATGRAVPSSVLRWLVGQLSADAPAEALARRAEAELRAAAREHLGQNAPDLTTNRGFWAEAYEARVLAAAGHTPPEVAARRHSVAAQLLRGQHPDIEALRAGDPRAIEALLRQHGNWQELMGVLALAGRGSAAWEIGRQVYAFREGVIRGLDRRFGARPVDSASTELISDVDLSVGTRTEHNRTPGAGRRLIAAEAEMARRFGPGWSEMLRMNFYTDASRLTRYEDVMGLMSPDAARALMARNAQASEVYDYAAMLLYAQHGGPGRAATVREQLSRWVDAETMTRIEALARLPEPERVARRNALIVEQDRLQRQFNTMIENLGVRRSHTISVSDQLSTMQERGRLSPAITRQLIALAEQISLRQSEANFYTTEAYISGGAGRMVVSGQRVTGPEAWAAARSQLAMIEHIIGQNHGDIGAAGRQYETYKYIERFVQAARMAGVDHVALAAYARLATLVNRLDRGAFSTSEAAFTAGRSIGPHGDVPTDVVANPSRLARWYAEEDAVFRTLPPDAQARALAAIDARMANPQSRPTRDVLIDRIVDRVVGRVDAPHLSPKIPEQNRVLVTDRVARGTPGIADATTEALLSRFLSVAHGVLGQLRAEAGVAPTPTRTPHDPVARQAQLESAMGDMRGRVPVSQDPTLPGATVLVRYQNGRLRVVAGPDATSGDIAAHLATVRALLPYEGPIGRIRRLGSRVAELITRQPGYGSRGFEASLEQKKLSAILNNLRAEEIGIANAIRSEQTSPDLAGRQARVQQRIAEVEAQLRVHEAELGSLARGRGFVAALSGKSLDAFIGDPNLIAPLRSRVSDEAQLSRLLTQVSASEQLHRILLRMDPDSAEAMLALAGPDRLEAVLSTLGLPEYPTKFVPPLPYGQLRQIGQALQFARDMDRQLSDISDHIYAPDYFSRARVEVSEPSTGAGHYIKLHNDARIPARGTAAIVPLLAGGSEAPGPIIRQIEVNDSAGAAQGRIKPQTRGPGSASLPEIPIEPSTRVTLHGDDGSQTPWTSRDVPPPGYRWEIRGNTLAKSGVAGGHVEDAWRDVTTRYADRVRETGRTQLEFTIPGHPAMRVASVQYETNNAGNWTPFKDPKTIFLGPGTSHIEAFERHMSPFLVRAFMNHSGPSNTPVFNVPVIGRSGKVTQLQVVAALSVDKTRITSWWISKNNNSNPDL